MTLTQDIALLLPVTALLPLTAILLVAQANPYQTLVLRGILGAVCALIYALLGAADVALTEALVGTLLSTTLYAVALRSSMVLRVAVAAEPPSQPLHEQLQEQLRSWLDPLSLRLELLSPTDPDLHAVLEPSGSPGSYCLRLHHAPLMERLAALPGAVRWREAGHGLELQPAAQPSQGGAP
jgi:putative multicomponent Na+:H+ antiporter subunit B